MTFQSTKIRFLDMCKSSNLPLLQSSNLPLLQSSNFPLLQSSNLRLLQSSNLRLLQSSNLRLLQSSNLRLLQSSNFQGKMLLDLHITGFLSFFSTVLKQLSRLLVLKNDDMSLFKSKKIFRSKKARPQPGFFSKKLNSIFFKKIKPRIF